MGRFLDGRKRHTVKLSSLPTLSSIRPTYHVLLKATLLDVGTNFDTLSKNTTLLAGVDPLIDLFDDEDQKVKNVAAEGYIAHVYRAHYVTNISVVEKDS